jgi:leader peptidase (prepilin peptidase)/N-methyltransferase
LKIIYGIFAFLLGSVIGSFLNVIIYRLPRGVSIVKPNSFCPSCKKPIKWFENIPVLSFIFLGGKCSKCRKSISIQYPAVEIITGLLFLWSYTNHGLSLNCLFYVLFFISLIVISGIDFSHQVIPDIFSIPGIILGIIFQWLNHSLLIGIVGMAFGGGLILLIRALGGWVYKKEVMGMGDVYLTAMIGAFVGFPLIIPAIFIAALFGSVFGIIYLAATRRNRENPIPFGPFLSLGGAVIVVFKPQVVELISTLGIYL